MHDFVTKLALLSKMWGSVSYTICPYPSRIITGSASKAEMVPNFTKPTFPKKGVGKFSKKKYISGITKASAFEWYASFVLSPPTPSNEPCRCRGLVRPPPLGVSKRSVVELSRKRPVDCARRLLAIGGIIFGPRLIFDPVMAGQRSNFRKFRDFLVSRVHISKTIDRSGMKPSPACFPFNSAQNEVFWCISVEYLGCIVLMNDTVSPRWRHRSNLWRHESATWHSNMIGISVMAT